MGLKELLQRVIRGLIPTAGGDDREKEKVDSSFDKMDALFSMGEEKPSRRTQALRERARQRRTRD